MPLLPVFLVSLGLSVAWSWLITVVACTAALLVAWVLTRRARSNPSPAINTNTLESIPTS